MPVLLALAAGLMVPLFVYGYHLRVAGRPAPADLDVLPVKKIKTKEFGPLGSIINPLGRPFAGLIVNAMSGAGRTRLRRRIDRAGRPAGLTVEGYAANKVGCVLFYGGASLVVMLAGQALIGVILLLIGLLQTDIVLWNLSRERQEEIQRSLPDFLDVLTVTVSAGLGFRHALARVAESMPGALADELNNALRQMELGTPLRDAFEQLRQRNDNAALASFVTAILQAEELGAPLARALTEISTDMRRDAFQQARRRAQRADPQITLIVTFLMVPAMLLLILGGLYFSMSEGILF
ncbi:membrane protein [Actinomadura sp. NBRC 104425]|uniref:type II secretion system F family protein n=1 Tax=Actinomadura sp. NBRC 104425 TaxID=3032204 RepID=UPI0024A0AC43|nr:type II secretion system F family protein [Actinomadura sp. NBRC 104425]GLZ09960.1 membrane protein [Actinomadura sp. NBRC 104425]